MQQFNPSAEPATVMPETIRPTRTRRTAGRGMAMLIVGIALLVGAPQLHAQGRFASASLVLQVGPEEFLKDLNGNVMVKIRLARGTMARLWAANSCTSPSAESHIIAVSGIYTIPYSALTPAGGPSSGSTEICLASSDGVLHDSLPVENLGAAIGAAVQGATPLMASRGGSPDVPAGWVVSTQAGQTTWSRP